MQRRATRTLIALLFVLPLACKSDAHKPADAESVENPRASADAEKPDAEPRSQVVEAPEPTADGVKLGDKAPDFQLTDIAGKTHTLSQYAGKTIVLEWFNPGCPFVKFAHGQGPLKDMGNEYGKDGLVWLAINSGAPGKQGHGLEANKKAAENWGIEYPILLDEEGIVGRSYAAKKTPHMFVIAEDGTVIYQGAIDNAPMGETQHGDAINYVEQCLTAKADGKAIESAETPPYGCTVKYAKT